MHEKTKHERGQELLNTLTPNQRKLTDDAITALRIEWAKLYGDRLPSILTEHLAVEAATHDMIIGAAHGLGPKSDEVRRVVAREVAEANPLVQRALDFADASLKAEIRDEKLSELSPTSRMQMAREQNLDAYLEKAIDREYRSRDRSPAGAFVGEFRHDGSG